MANYGELAITKEMYNVTRNGKHFKENVVGRLAYNTSRLLCDSEGGFIEVDKSQLVAINGMRRVVISSLGAGVVETYLAVETDLDKFLVGTSRDFASRSIKNLPWVSAPTKDLVLLSANVVAE
jgi:hypothetical protein